MASVALKSDIDQALSEYGSSNDPAKLLSVYSETTSNAITLQYFYHIFLRQYRSLSLPIFLNLLTLLLSQPHLPDLPPNPHFIDSLCFLDAEIDELVSSEPALSTQREKDERDPWVGVCRAVFQKGLIKEDTWDRFDFPFWERLGILGSGLKATTSRSTRKSTIAFFSLKKYNLLRESSEGFSLLLVLLNTPSNLGPGKDTQTAQDIESSSQRMNRARSLWNKIMSTIGYFDLDPSKTLDLILDAFVTNLATHHRFFLDLLRVSPWAPSASSSAEGGEGKGLEGKGGNFVLAQVLGFRFAYYQDQDVLRRGESTPKELGLVAAVLIKDGFVKLTDLWVHLSPDEAEMNKHETRFRQAVNELARASKGNALLASAAPLLDDDAPVSSKVASTNGSSTPVVSPPLALPQQKIELVEALMAVGAREEVEYLTTRFAALGLAEMGLADLRLRSLWLRLEGLVAPRSAGRSTTVGKGKREGRLSTIAPTPIQTAKERFVWFYPEWEEGLEKVLDLNEFFDEGKGVEKELRGLGGLVGRDMKVLIGVCRLGVKDVSARPTDEPILARWATLVRQVFLPSLSLFGGSSTAQEIWYLLSLYPFETRFGMYGYWKALYTTSLQLKVQGAVAERDAKSALRRVSKDDLKLHARALGKLSHSDPLVTWGVALRQVQSYDNLVKPLVESARFITPLGADVVVFMLLDAFSNPEKERMKTDGTSTSLWLKSLAAFAGELCRRHHNMIDCTPILHYVANQLRAGNSKDLIILRELVSAMTSIDPLANLSDNQIAAQGGGPILRGEVITPTVTLLKPPLAPGAEPRPAAPIEKKGATGKSAVKLLKSLQTSGLLLPLLVVVAQTRDSCMFTVPEAEAHMKHLSSLFDNSTEVLLQFVEFLQQHLSAEEYATVIPSFSDLVEKYAISPALAFHILRPKLSFNIKKFDEEKAKKAALEAAAETPAAKEARLKLALNSKRATPTTAGEGGEQGDKSSAAPKPEGKYHPALRDTITAAVKYLPQDAKSTSPFFVTFWQLTPYDIEVPLTSYQLEIERLNRAEKDLARFPASAQTGEWFREREKLKLKAKQLQLERDQQMEAYAVTKRRLAIEKNVWFRKNTDPKALNQHLFQHCIFPRAMLSLSDAAYCAKFIKIMHNMGTCNFSSLWFYNLQILHEWLPPLVSSFTENEARNFAHFMHDCLEELTAWHVDQNRYLKEAQGDKEILPGFLSNLNRPHSAASLDSKAPLLEWDGYRKVMHKWHIRLLSAFDLCLASTEYAHIKNMVIILQKILPFFPRDIVHGEAMEAKLKVTIPEEKREDLKLLLQSYSSQLSKLRKSWIPQSQFLNLNFTAAKTKSTTSEIASPAPSHATISALPNAEPTLPPRAPDQEVTMTTSPEPATTTPPSSAPPPPEASERLAPTAPKSDGFGRGPSPHLSTSAHMEPLVDAKVPTRPKAAEPLRSASSMESSSSSGNPTAIDSPVRPVGSTGLKALPMNPSRLRTSVLTDARLPTAPSTTSTPAPPSAVVKSRSRSPPRGPRNSTGALSADTAKGEAKEARDQELARERARLKEIAREQEVHREKDQEKEEKKVKERERDRQREKEKEEKAERERPREREKDRDRRESDRDGKRRRERESPDGRRRRDSPPHSRARSPGSSRDQRPEQRESRDRDSRRSRTDTDNSSSRFSTRRSASPAASVRSNGRERRERDDRDGRSREANRTKSSRPQDRSDRDRHRERERTKDRDDHGRSDRDREREKRSAAENRNDRRGGTDQRSLNSRSRDQTPKFEPPPSQAVVRSGPEVSKGTQEGTEPTNESRKREREEASTGGPDQPVKKRISRNHRYGLGLEAAMQAASKDSKR